MSISVHTEWDSLNVIIVGSAINARYPNRDSATFLIDYADNYNNVSQIPSGFYNQKIVDETEEDLGQLIELLEKLDIKVKRPSVDFLESSFSNGLWNATPEHVFCPRDSIVLIGNMVIEAPMVSRDRYFETFAFREIIKKHFDAGGYWISAPKPMLSDETFNFNTSDGFEMLTEYEPIYDAANILRVGEDILYLVSRSGNKSGAKWLQNILGTRYKVHLIEGIYDGTHIDTTIALVRPGLVILNPDRISKDNLPNFMKMWDIIYADNMIDVGYSGEKPRASVAQAMNIRMVNPQLAIVEERQLPLIKKLNEKGIDVQPLPMRHSRSLCGGFHCATLDLQREGELERYS